MIRDMVLITENSAMRVDELCQLKPAEIDRSDAEVWIYRPPSHKTDRHDGDKPKEIPIGPKSHRSCRNT